MDCEYVLFEMFPNHTYNGAGAFAEVNVRLRHCKKCLSKRTTSALQPNWARIKSLPESTKDREFWRMTVQARIKITSIQGSQTRRPRNLRRSTRLVPLGYSVINAATLRRAVEQGRARLSNAPRRALCEGCSPFFIGSHSPVPLAARRQFFGDRRSDATSRPHTGPLHCIGTVNWLLDSIDSIDRSCVEQKATFREDLPGIGRKSRGHSFPG
jgi:hypothetical protein